VQYYRSLYNVEQVEFLRGPNALLFGRGGTGGIINRVMKKGIVGERFNNYQLSVDTFGAYSAQIDSNFAINDDSAFRINLAYEHLDNHRPYYDGDRWGVNPTVKFQISENTVLDLSFEYVDHERFIDRGIPTGDDGEPLEEFEDTFFGDTELNYTDLEAHLLRATLQHRFSDELKLRLSAFYGDYDKVYSNFYASDYDPVNREATLDGYIDSTQRENLILSADLIGEFETGSIDHTVVSGIEFIDTINDNDRFNPQFDTKVADQLANPGDTSIRTDIETFAIGNQVLRDGVGVNSRGDLTTVNLNTVLNDNTASDVRAFSFYIQDEIALNEKFDLILGARYDRFEIDANDKKNNLRRSRTDDEITPRLGIVFKPEETVSLYASYSETFLPASGEQFATINDRTAALDPEEFTNLEAGIKWDFENGLSLTAAVFQLEKSSPETARDDAAAVAIVESTIQGFEAQLQGKLTEQWFLSAGYSYLDGEVEDQNPAIDGNRPRELPEHMFSVWNQYQVTKKLGLGLGLIYQGEVFINTGNQTKLPSYARVDAAAYYQLTDHLRLQVNIENVTDELYFPNAHADHQATVGAPIHARFAISGRF
jgi:catecholate siderophore receptor